MKLKDQLIKFTDQQKSDWKSDLNKLQTRSKKAKKVLESWN